MTNKIEVLLVTMNQSNIDFLQNINISDNADVVVCNQSNCFDYQLIQNGKQQIKFITHNTRGVGINRNMGLLNSSADILLFADDDIVYTDDIFDKIIEVFNDYPDVDGFIFNVDTIGMDMGRRINKKMNKVCIHNFLNYGAVRLAVRKRAIKKYNIYFSEMFGGGALYGSGEDTLFIRNCLKNGLKLYTYPLKIADVYQNESTWFTGYNEKYFYDKGALLYMCFRHMYLIVIFAYALKSCKTCKLSFIHILKLMLLGTKKYKLL